MWNEKLRGGRVVETSISNVCHYSHNLARQVVAVAPPTISNAQSLSERILIWKNAACERFIDDDF